jgi:hypothetical protein
MGGNSRPQKYIARPATAPPPSEISPNFLTSAAELLAAFFLVRNFAQISDITDRAKTRFTSETNMFHLASALLHPLSNIRSTT